MRYSVWLGGAKQTNKQRRFSPKLSDWENYDEVSRKTEDARTGKQVCGLGGLNSVLSTELEVQVEMPSCQSEMQTRDK